jgi:hypothetical protein
LAISRIGNLQNWQSLELAISRMDNLQNLQSPELAISRICNLQNLQSPEFAISRVYNLQNWQSSELAISRIGNLQNWQSLEAPKPDRRNRPDFADSFDVHPREVMFLSPKGGSAQSARFCLTRGLTPEICRHRFGPFLIFCRSANLEIGKSRNAPGVLRQDAPKLQPAALSCLRHRS